MQRLSTISNAEETRYRRNIFNLTSIVQFIRNTSQRFDIELLLIFNVVDANCFESFKRRKRKRRFTYWLR